MGKTDGTAFVDITDAKAPRLVGELPSHQQNPATGDPEETIFNVWRDIKVYKDHAFVVSEEPTHGMQVFDLTRLRGVTEPQTFDNDAHYSFVQDGPESIFDPPPLDPGDPPLITLDNAHNIAINEESGTAYAVGTSTCAGGGPHMIDISTPQAPEFAGCVSEDSYTHDTQCVNYRPTDPDGAQFGGKEICFSSNEDSLTIVDVTDKSNPIEIVRKEYDGSAYSHQGWLTEDRRYFLLGDELDEIDNGVEKTRTYVFNVEKLSLPSDPVAYDAPAESIDHNMYTKGQRMYQANYRSGLRILDNSKLAEGGAPIEEALLRRVPRRRRPRVQRGVEQLPLLPLGQRGRERHRAGPVRPAPRGRGSRWRARPARTPRRSRGPVRGGSLELRCGLLARSGQADRLRRSGSQAGGGAEVVRIAGHVPPLHGPLLPLRRKRAAGGLPGHPQPEEPEPTPAAAAQGPGPARAHVEREDEPPGCARGHHASPAAGAHRPGPRRAGGAQHVGTCAGGHGRARCSRCRAGASARLGLADLRRTRGSAKAKRFLRSGR